MVRRKYFIQALSVLILVYSPLAHADVLDDIIDRGTIRVGVSEFVPWTITTKSGELIGFEIDIARKIASDMNVTPEFKVYELENIIPAVQRGEIDIIAGGLSITPGRALQVNFSRPLANQGVGLATNTEKTQTIRALSDLNNERVTISVVADTLAQDVAQTFFDQASIDVYATQALAQNEIIEGRAHAYLATVAAINYLALTNPGKVDLPLSEPLLASSEGLAIKKGEQELLNFLDAWVVARQADKWLGTTHEYWFNTIEWVAQASQ